MKRISLAVWVLMILLNSAIEAQKATSNGLHRNAQTQFGAEERIKRPVKIPTVVLRMLRQDERVQQCFQNDPNLSSDITKWFTASSIDLDNDRQPDLVVKPENSCLFGANIISFWIFRNTRGDYKLALKAHTHSLSILRSRTNSYRDVSIHAASASMVFGADYKFDGNRYMPKRCWEQSIDEAQKAGSKVNVIPCSGDVEKPYRD